MEIITESRVVQHFLENRRARVTGPTRAVIEEGEHYPRTVAVIRFDHDGTVTATPGNPDLEPTPDEAKDIMEDVAGLDEISEGVILRRAEDKLLKKLKTPGSRLFWFRDRLRPLFVVELIVDKKNGGKI